MIITLSIVLGAELGPKANAATTTYTPRPEWYFFFLFELLRVIKPPNFVGLATIGVPTIGMILLFLLPFYDRGPERHPLRRPVATLTGIFVILAMALPDLPGRQRRAADRELTIKPSATVIAEGKAALQQFYFGRAGRRAVGLRGVPQDRRQRQRRPGPGADADRQSRVPAEGIARTLVNPTEPMPSFAALPKKQFSAAVAFLSDLK